jgi:hypothetical protein
MIETLLDRTEKALSGPKGPDLLALSGIVTEIKNILPAQQGATGELS